MYIHTDGLTETCTDGQTHIDTHRHRWTHRHAQTKTHGGHTDGHRHRQTHTHTHRHIYTQTDTHRLYTCIIYTIHFQFSVLVTATIQGKGNRKLPRRPYIN